MPLRTLAPTAAPPHKTGVGTHGSSSRRSRVPPVTLHSRVWSWHVQTTRTAARLWHMVTYTHALPHQWAAAAPCTPSPLHAQPLAHPAPCTLSRVLARPHALTSPAKAQGTGSVSLAAPTLGGFGEPRAQRGVVAEVQFWGTEDSARGGGRGGSLALGDDVFGV